MKKKTFDDPNEESAGWMATFADLMTLLLVFFILLFSMSSVQTEQFQRVIASIQSALSGESAIAALDFSGDRMIPTLEQFPETRRESDSNQDKGSNHTNQNDPNPALDQAQENPNQVTTQPSVGDKGEDWKEIANTVRSRLYQKVIEQTVQVKLPKDGVVSIEVDGSVMFDSGSIYLNSEADPVLNQLQELFRQYPGYSINIKGHTDNIPISTLGLESNWELSAVRATTVLRYFVKQGMNPRRFTATGFGSSVPIADNSTPEGRQKNRRIEFVLEKQQSRVFD